MSAAENPQRTRWTGRRIIVRSLQIAGAGLAPLLLYIMLGPADGNPIGLGLLAGLAMLIAKVGLLIGLLKLFGEQRAQPNR